MLPFFLNLNILYKATLIKIPVVLLFSIWTVGCQKPTSNTVFRIQPNEVAAFRTSAFCERIDYLVLEKNSKNPISTISDVIFKNGIYYISDEVSNVLTAYNEQGEFIFEIDELGYGFGKYMEITDLFVEDCIYVLCRTERKIIQYDIDTGDVIAETKLPLYIDGLRSLEKNTYISYSSTGGEITKNGRKAAIGKFIGDSIYKIEKSFGDNYPQYSFPSKHYFSSTDNNGYLLLNPSDSIYAYANGKVIVKYTLDFGVLQLPKEKQTLQNTPANREFLQQSPYVIFKDNLVDTQYFLFMSFIQGSTREIKYLLYNKRSAQGVHTSSIINDLESAKPYNFPQFKKDNNTVISVVELDLIKYYYNRILPIKEQAVQSMGENKFHQLNSFYKKCLKNAQPVLVISHLKTGASSL
tara:strand:- start:618 stop:1847 length:1230 start_codon:yes stop_codon:yes gene_type:complete